ncbi:MAG: DNA polymerase III subunit delta, partial [Gemmiger sp.]
MLYSEKESDKQVKNGCGVFYFYSSDEALIRSAAQRVLKVLSRDDPEITVLDGPAPSVEEIILAAGTISFFGGRRLVQMPLLKPSAYSDKDLAELCDTLRDTENAVFVITSLMEEKYGKLRPGKREQKLIATCEKLGYCAELHLPGRATLQKMLREWAEEMGTAFAPGAESALLDRCGDDQFLLRNEVEKLAALSGYTQITCDLIAQLGTVTLDADTFDMVKLVVSGQTGKALKKLETLL